MRTERKDDIAMMRLFELDAERERRRRAGRRLFLAIVFVAAIWYGIECQRACIADQDGCRAAMQKYDGYPPPPQVSTSR